MYVYIIYIPICEPWCWNICQHLPEQKHPVMSVNIPYMGHMGYRCAQIWIHRNMCFLCKPRCGQFTHGDSNSPTNRNSIKLPTEKYDTGKKYRGGYMCLPTLSTSQLSSIFLKLQLTTHRQLPDNSQKSFTTLIFFSFTTHTPCIRLRFESKRCRDESCKQCHVLLSTNMEDN